MSSKMVRVGTEGLYLHTSSGTYYARYRLHGKQPWKSLKTKVLTQARLKLREKMVEVEKARAAAAPSAELQTLGDCDRLLRAQLNSSQQSERTKKNYCDQLSTMARNWPLGDYAAFRPAKVDFAVLLKVRQALLEDATWTYNGGKKKRRGYSNAYTNQCMARLGNVLEIARLNGLMHVDPFTTSSVLQSEIWLPNLSRKPEMPSRLDMDRLFAEMVNVVPGPRENKSLAAWRRDRALDAAEHARFLAYSGMRLEEANRMTWDDIRPDALRVQGVAIVKGRAHRQTKTISGDRFVPIVGAMRELLDEIRARRTAAGAPLAGRILVPHTSLNALRGACERLKLPRLKHHDLRHYFATTCLESPAVDMLTLSKWLGHSDGGVLVQRTYGHLRREHSQRVAATVSFRADASAPTTPA
ncbi:MAG TPA: tyrosine-type recombinase/integrase [Lacunisphaera sp.]|nr:tyrosine-type recombinase/integrase [Lacunisphaera sp.]